MSDQEQKDIVKQAIKEWMDERLREFGWWSLKTLAIAALTVLLFAYVKVKGFSFP